ncbi:MAG: hypothetical protein GY950_04150 [bacterium]|nr:hypothetical protein [bacterium]
MNTLRNHYQPFHLFAALGVLLAAVVLNVYRAAGRLPYIMDETPFLPSLLFFVLMLGVWGAAASRALDRPHLLYLVPLAVLLSNIFPRLEGSHIHLNALLNAALFAALLYMWLFFHQKKDTFFHKAVIPGVLGGIVLSSGYFWFVILLPPLLAILFYCREKKFLKSLLLAGVMLITSFLMLPVSFFIFVPFKIASPLSSPSVGAAGLPDTWFAFPALFEWAGPGVFIAALAGLVFLFLNDWKKALIFIFFPFALLACPLLAAFALVELFRLLKKAFGRIEWKWLRPEKSKTIAAVFFAVVLVVVLFPVSKIVTREGVGPDSRRRAVSRIRQNIAAGASLAVPLELNLQTSALRENYKLYPFTFQYLETRELHRLAALLDSPYFLVPSFGSSGSDPLVQKETASLNRFRDRLDTSGVFEEFDGNDVLIDSYYPFTGNPAFVVGRLKKEFIPSVTRIDLLKRNLVRVLSKRGEFSLDASESGTWKVLTLRNQAPGEEGKRFANVGVACGRRGFGLEIPVGRDIFLVVNAAISPGLVMDEGKENYLLISDFKGRWDSEKHYFVSSEWRTYIVSKRVRPGSNRVILGIRFTPRASADVLRIRSVHVFVSTPAPITEDCG